MASADNSKEAKNSEGEEQVESDQHMDDEGNGGEKPKAAEKEVPSSPDSVGGEPEQKEEESVEGAAASVAEGAASRAEDDELDPEVELKSKYGMGFTAEGRLRQYSKKTGKLDDDRAFEFDVFGGVHKKNQARYEDIGKILNRCVYKFLETRTGLKRVAVGRRGEFVFVSKDLNENTKKLMVIIHGSGTDTIGWSYIKSLLKST